MDVANMIEIGFDFLQSYILQTNQQSGVILRIKEPKPMTSISYSYGMGYTTVYKKEEKEKKPPMFKVQKSPGEVTHLDIVWDLALYSGNAQVVPKAIEFLIKLHTEVDAELQSQRVDFIKNLVERCFDLIREDTEETVVIRIIEILKHIILETEKKGTGDVYSHNALLKGELLNKIVVYNKTSYNQSSIQMALYANSTVWELKKQISKALNIGTKYLQLEMVRP